MKLMVQLATIFQYFGQAIGGLENIGIKKKRNYFRLTRSDELLSISLINIQVQMPFVVVEMVVVV